ncbi:hypothetical protein Ciccas_013371 [Cichlidogyrus casuarinus]|uniref:Uncharacterized protein n=1 Tax=Cichlidogyrus casuarinus TaxID=1844966 RepID=A0ABD2PKR2_9PLAT
MGVWKVISAQISLVLASLESHKQKLILFFISILLQLMIVHVLRRFSRLDRVMKFVLSGFYYHLTGPLSVQILYYSTLNYLDDLFARVICVVIRFFFYMNLYAQQRTQPHLYLDERFGSSLVSKFLILTSFYDVVRHLYFIRHILRYITDWGLQTTTQGLLYIFIVLVIYSYNCISGTTIIFAASIYLTIMSVYLIHRGDPIPEFCSSLFVAHLESSEIKLIPVNIVLRVSRHSAASLPILRGIETKRQFLTVQAISLVFDVISVLSHIYLRDWGFNNIKANSLDRDLMEGVIIKVILVIVLKIDIFINIIFDYLLPKKLLIYLEIGQMRIKRAIKCLLYFIFTMPPFYYPLGYFEHLSNFLQTYHHIIGSNFLLCFFCKEAGMHHFLIMLVIQLATVLFLRPINEEIHAFVDRQSLQISSTVWSSFIIVMAGVLAYCVALPVLSPCRLGPRLVTYGISIKRAFRESLNHSSKQSAL